MFKKKLFFFVFFIVTMPVFAATQRMILNHKWMNDNFQSIESTLSNDEEVFVIPVINTLVEIWLNRDGAISREVSLLIVIALIYNAEPTLILLSENPYSFNRWLNELDGVVFTDHTGTDFDKLNNLKYQAIESMRAYSKHGRAELILFAHQLIEQLESISVQTVD